MCFLRPLRCARRKPPRLYMILKLSDLSVLPSRVPPPKRVSRLSNGCPGNDLAPQAGIADIEAGVDLVLSSSASVVENGECPREERALAGKRTLPATTSAPSDIVDTISRAQSSVGKQNRCPGARRHHLAPLHSCASCRSTRDPTWYDACGRIDANTCSPDRVALLPPRR